MLKVAVLTMRGLGFPVTSGEAFEDHFHVHGAVHIALRDGHGPGGKHCEKRMLSRKSSIFALTRRISGKISRSSWSLPGRRGSAARWPEITTT